MQTFLPYPDFVETAKCLDFRRLGKQRVECYQILKTLTGASKAWSFHPIMKMWKGYEYWLWSYGICICAEWRARGYKDTVMDKLDSLRRGVDLRDNFIFRPREPFWYKDERIYTSHRAALLNKNPEWYGKFGWTEEPKIEYYWPTNEHS